LGEISAGETGIRTADSVPLATCIAAHQAGTLIVKTLTVQAEFISGAASGTVCNDK
jgi:hypothetical protein